MLIFVYGGIYSAYIIDKFIMEKDFECIKIKDGLYIGNKLVAMVPPSPLRTCSSS
jgi:hypothetical protein